MALKGNRGPLLAAAQAYAQAQPAHGSWRQHERTRQRRTTRRVQVWALPRQAPWTQWAGARSLVRLTRSGWRQGRRHEQVHYYLSSLPPRVRLLGRLIRQHWTIENGLHYVRDTSLQEDRSRWRRGAAPHVLALLHSWLITLCRLHGFASLPLAQARLAHDVKTLLRWTT